MRIWATPKLKNCKEKNTQVDQVGLAGKKTVRKGCHWAVRVVVYDCLVEEQKKIVRNLYITYTWS